MALTLAQIQANITNKMDARLILNQIADYLEANPGGGGSGMVLESYENSAMSAPVMAYVFRDADDNIFEVYEPIKGNRVRRSRYSYADSIDKFPFDNVNCHSNPLIFDAKLMNLASDVKIRGCNLDTLVINANNHTGFDLTDHVHKGTFDSNAPNGAEIYITGNGVILLKNTCLAGSFFDSLGTNCSISNSTLHWGAGIYGNSKTGIIMSFGLLNAEAQVQCRKNSGAMNDFYIGSSSIVQLGSSAHNIFYVGESSEWGDSSNGFSFHTAEGVDIESFAFITPDTDDDLDFFNSKVGVGAEVAIATSKDGVEYKQINGTTYELAITDIAGTLTLTATAV